MAWAGPHSHRGGRLNERVAERQGRGRGRRVLADAAVREQPDHACQDLLRQPDGLRAAQYLLQPALEVLMPAAFTAEGVDADVDVKQEHGCPRRRLDVNVCIYAFRRESRGHENFKSW